MNSSDTNRGEVLKCLLGDLSITTDLKLVPTSYLGLSIATYNALGRRGITDLAALLENCDNIFSGNFWISGMGRRQEIVDKVQSWLAQKDHNNQPSPNSDLGAEQTKVNILNKDLTSLRQFTRYSAIRIEQNISEWINLQHTLNPLMLEEFYNFTDTGEYPRPFPTALQGWPRVPRLKSQTEIQLIQQPVVSITDSINIFLMTLKESQRKVVEELYGFHTGQTTTLQVVSTHLGLTRERIRQIKTHVLRLFHQKKYFRPIESYITDLTSSENGVTSHPQLISKMNEEFGSSDLKVEGILEFYLDWQKQYQSSQVKYLNFLGCWCNGDDAMEKIEKIAELAPQFIESAGKPLQWDELYKLLTSTGGLYTLDEELALAILNCLRDNDKIERLTDGGWSLPRSNLKRKDRIIFTLRHIGHPAHYSEITKVHNELFPDKSITEHGINAVIHGNSPFARVGRGRYGLLEWGLPEDGSLGNAICRILNQKNRSMTTAEITKEILETWKVQPVSIIAAIDTDNRFVRLGNGQIGLTEIGRLNERRNKRHDPNQPYRLNHALAVLGGKAHYSRIVEKHNQIYPDLMIKPAKASALMKLNANLFINNGDGYFSIADN